MKQLQALLMPLKHRINRYRTMKAMLFGLTVGALAAVVIRAVILVIGWQTMLVFLPWLLGAGALYAL